MRGAARIEAPLCTDPADVAWPDALLCEHHGHGDYIPQRMMIYDRYKYVAALFDGDEMYDLEADPYEMNNLIAEPSVRDLRNELRDRLIAQGATACIDKTSLVDVADEVARATEARMT